MTLDVEDGGIKLSALCDRRLIFRFTRAAFGVALVSDPDSVSEAGGSNTLLGSGECVRTGVTGRDTDLDLRNEHNDHIKRKDILTCSEN